MDENNTSIAGRLTIRNEKTSKEEKMLIMPLSLLNGMMTDLDRAEIRMLLYILSKAQYGKNPSVTLPSRRTLGEILNMSASSVVRAVKALESKGFIKANKKGGKDTCILTCPKIEKEVDDDFVITLW